jgi:hypothetical protein
MTYGILDLSLHATADAAAKYFRVNRGITRTFEIESPILDIPGLRPTLSVLDPDGYYICIEVRETVYHMSLDTFVLNCKNRNLPVKLYVAMPKNSSDSNFQENVRRARQNGVGVLLVDDIDGEMLYEALALSLTGLRRVDPKEFPPKYRSAILEAEKTFQDGHPQKGCAAIFDELEAVTRKVAEKTYRKGAWKNLKPGGTGTPPDFNRQNWMSLLQQLMKELDPTVCGCPQLNSALLSRIIGITPHRNDSGHKPRTVAARQKRDNELRTRFEHAYDALRDTLKAAKPLHI